MKIITKIQPWSHKVFVELKEWVFPYDVYDLIELQDRIIVHFHSSEFFDNPPDGVDPACNIWCYDKKTRKIKWIIESPPPCTNIYGTVVNKGGEIDIDGVARGYHEAYLVVQYNKFDDMIRAFSDGALYKVNLENGSVVLLRENLK